MSAAGPAGGGAGRGGTFWRESLLAFGPHAGAHRVAIRASISTFVPLVALLLLDRPEWAPWAAFGAFTALYGRNRVHLSRLTMQLTAAGVLVTMVGLGSLVATLPAPTWPMIVAGAVLAGLISIVSDAEDWHPPGPLFALFAPGRRRCPTAPSPLPARPPWWPPHPQPSRCWSAPRAQPSGGRAGCRSRSGS